MDPQAVREQAQAFCATLVAGDMDRAAEELSRELRANLGPLVAILPLPLTEATVESVEVGGSGYIAVLHLTGESGATRLQTRWKDRDGRPTIVEASHIAEPVTQEASSEVGSVT
ncbi:MAG: hypothetical protein Q7S35_11555 [Candidatus Limnocylindrales bacterium]|nr:hypothetical protein [Candidatus Limnocylindrales bacterium]